MSIKIKLLFIFVFISTFAFSQKKWTLLECVQYAMDHNISIQQSALQEDIATIIYKQSKLSQIPSANISNNEGLRYGKSQNPSTGILENQNYFSVGLNLQSSAVIFNWFSKKNTILANEWSAEAAKAATDKLKNDISLTVANSYLQILLSREQEKIATVQVQQSRTQLEIVQKQVAAGALAEYNATELESQLANDTANLITATGNVAQAKYVLKAYMNLDAADSFDIAEPPLEQIPIMPIGELQPESVYTSALQNQPQQKENEYNLKAAEKNSLAAKGALYPTISAYGNLGSNYGYFRTPKYTQVFNGYVPSGLVVSDNSGGYVDVQKPLYTNGGKNGYITSDKFGTQFSNNFGQSVGISLSIPIFNGWQSKANYQRSKINIKTLQFQQDLDNKTLKQNIYQAYNAAVVAMQKLSSTKRAVEAAQKTYDYALKRYQAGMLRTLDLITNENSLFTAKLQYTLNRFDYVFKMKVLEYYKGQGIKF
ncbi:MAG: TolC family protein [Bacteroidota bacterium]|nr:TolC family protein [Bacteroidota bacterium]